MTTKARPQSTTPSCTAESAPIALVALLWLSMACEAAPPTPHPEPLASKPIAGCGAARDCKTSAPFVSASRSKEQLVAVAPKGSRYSYASCEDDRRIEKWDEAAGWVKLVDERPPSQEGWRFYIGEHFINHGGNEGCDVHGCATVEGMFDLGELAEYVKVGSKAVPTDIHIGPPMVAVFERRPVEGPVRGSMLVSQDSSCSAPRRVYAVP